VVSGPNYIVLTNPTFITLPATAIHHCLSAWKTGEFRVPPEFGPGGEAQCKCDTRNINHVVNNTCTDVYHHYDTDFHCSSPEIRAKTIDHIRIMICQRIHSTGTDPAMAQPHNDQRSIDEDFLDYVPEELIEHVRKNIFCYV